MLNIAFICTVFNLLFFSRRPCIYNAQISLPEPLEAKETLARSLYPWRAFLERLVMHCTWVYCFQKSLCRDSVGKWLNTMDICSKRSPFFALIFAVSLMKDERFMYQALMQRNKPEDWEGK